jgi:phenol 2-monooxygenase
MLDFPSTGRFRILFLTSTDLLTPSGESATSLNQIPTTLKEFPAGIIELVVLHPLESNTFVWTDIPELVKTYSEMRFYNGIELEDAYKIFGVDPKKGAIAVVRPDGYIGTIAELKDTARIGEYLKQCLRQGAAD